MFDNELPKESRQAESAISYEQIRNLPIEDLFDEIKRRQSESEISARRQVVNELPELRRLELEVQRLKAEMEKDKKITEQRLNALEEAKEESKEKSSPWNEKKTPLKRQIDDSESGESWSKRNKSNNKDIHRPGPSGIQLRRRVLSSESGNNVNYNSNHHNSDEDEEQKSPAQKYIVGEIIDDPDLIKQLYPPFRFNIRCADGYTVYVTAYDDLAKHLEAKGNLKKGQTIKLVSPFARKLSREKGKTTQGLEFYIEIKESTDVIKIAKTGRETKVPQFRPKKN